MPKLVSPVSAPRQRGKDYKKYICHQSVVRSMIINLEKMSYITTEDRENFKIQTFKILMVISKWWWYQNGEDLVLYLLFNLFNYLGGEGCFYNKSELTIFHYNTPLAKPFYSSYTLNKKLFKTCNSRFLIIHVQLVPDSGLNHTNLLIMDSEKKIAWRVEPNNGPNWDGYATYVNPILSQFSKDFGLTFKGNYSGDCPLWISKIPNVILKHLPISNTSNYLPHAGLCMFLSIGRYVYGNKLTDDILITFIIGFIKSEMKKICG